MKKEGSCAVDPDMSVLIRREKIAEDVGATYGMGWTTSIKGSAGTREAPEV